MLQLLYSGKFLFVRLRDDIIYEDTPTMRGYYELGYLILHWTGYSFKFFSPLVKDGSYFDTCHSDYVEYIVVEYGQLLSELSAR